MCGGLFTLLLKKLTGKKERKDPSARNHYYGPTRAPSGDDLSYNTRCNQYFIPRLPDSMRERPQPYGVRYNKPTHAFRFNSQEPAWQHYGERPWRRSTTPTEFTREFPRPLRAETDA